MVEVIHPSPLELHRQERTLQILNAWFYITSNFFSRDFAADLYTTLYTIYYILYTTPYSTGLIKATYISPKALILAPQSDPVKHLIIFKIILHFFSIFSMWTLQFSLESNKTPKNLKEFTCSICFPYINIFVVLTFFLVKTIIFVFSIENLNPHE